MQIIVNDQPTDVPNGTTIMTLLGQLQIPGSRVAIEVNRQLVRRSDHASTVLHPGDLVEVVTLVGGG